MNPPDQSKHKLVKLVEDEILQYLADNPNAQDTLDGIVRFWLWGKYNESDVKEVLEKLVAEDLVIAQKGSDAQTRYKVNDKQLENIRSNLQDRS